MVGKIDEYGSLSIRRALNFKQQYCRFDKCECSDACPLFGEPKAIDLGFGGNGNGPTVHHLDICHGKTLKFDELIDEREKSC